MDTASARPSILSIRDLHLHFDGGKTRALDGVDLDIAEGEFVAITGPSGCGKSSLLNLIGTLDMPTSGELFFRGQSYSGIPDLALFRRRNIGFVFQSFHLIPTLTTLDNVLVPTIGTPDGATSHRERARELLHQLGLQDRIGHFPTQLSGGERQRTAIARAMINNPAMILADEPTGSLDSANAGHVLDVIAGMRKTTPLTVLMVTHDHGVSARADRIIPMCDGRIAERMAA
ncbi:MAG: ABC transporter ATP-binding protein [Nitrosomonadales bacterium]|nr:ABC transporter ATP-binding protein [Nitrosomonadales bacterium]